MPSLHSHKGSCFLGATLSCASNNESRRRGEKVTGPSEHIRIYIYIPLAGKGTSTGSLPFGDIIGHCPGPSRDECTHPCQGVVVTNAF